ncbi:MAG: hypothetical protein ABI806_17200 [Candidatus Solibacter sp.]
MKPAILLGLALMAHLSAPLFGQEHATAGHLYFTKAYRGADPLPQIVTVTGTGSGKEFAASARTSAGGAWLSVSPDTECCIAPAPLTLSVKPDSTLAPGNYSGQVVLTGSDGDQVIDVDLIVTPPQVPAFDRTPAQLSFAIQPGDEVLPQMMQIGSVGAGSLSWVVVPSANFLKVSVESGTAPTRISVGIIRDNLPGKGRNSGVYTAQLRFVSAGSTTTIPVTVAVGDTELRWTHRMKAMKAAGTLIASPAAGPVNLWPANTANCLCGHFNNQNTGYGSNTLAPAIDGTNSGQQVVESNSVNGAVPHYQVLFQDLGAGPRTISFYLKAGTDTLAYLTSEVDGAAAKRFWFDLTTGTPGNNAIPPGWVVHTPVDAGNGWFRYAVSFTATIRAVNNGFGLAVIDQQSDFVATNGRGIYQWGQQAEVGLTPTAYQANDATCMDTGVQRSGTPIPAGSPIAFTVSAINHATPSNAATLNAPLPAGSGINWSISPAYPGPGTCAINGAVGGQTLACDLGVLAAGAGASVRVLSGTNGSSCGVYGVTSTLTGGGTSFTASDSITVQCSAGSPVLAISKTHSGNFTPGQAGAIYSVVVSNSGAASSGTVTVTETIPAGLTLVSMSGLGWTCPGGTTCTRSDSLATSSSYPAITVTVNVSPTAPASVTNLVAVSGGGDPSNHSASDPTTIVTLPTTEPLRFVPVTPCRIADTRLPAGPFGGPSLAAAVPRDFNILNVCGVPANARAYSLNLTVVPLGALGFLSVWPAGQPQPVVSTLNSGDGRVKANAAIVPAGTNGAITLFASNPTNAIIDVNGYFVPVSVANALQFYPVTPCRIADTRGAAGTFGGPALGASTERNFPITGVCGIPASAQAFALNMTVVPSGPLGFLSAWPAGQGQPGSSTLNAPTGAITANAAIVPAGTGGAITVVATNPTNLIIDINGYFAPPGAGGLQFYTATPCRIADTRGAVGPFGGPQLPAGTAREFSVTASACSIPAGAGAYSLNATVVPPAALGFLSLWGSGGQPSVSTLNASDGSVVANAALVPASNTGSVTAIGSHATNLILDINGYFAQ